MERLYLATEEISRLKDIRFHEAIRKDQGPRPISEDRRMLADFLDVARQSGAVEIRGDTIIKKQLGRELHEMKDKGTDIELF